MILRLIFSEFMMYICLYKSTQF